MCYPFAMLSYLAFLSSRLVVTRVCFIDPGKVLPEPEDYSVFWLQSTAGEMDSRTGVPPAFLSLRVQDFLNGPGKLTMLKHTYWT